MTKLAPRNANARARRTASQRKAERSGFKRATTYKIINVSGALVLMTWVVFARTIGFGFVNYDDPKHIYENPHVTGGLSWSGLAWAFRADKADYWHPLDYVSHMIVCQLGGLNPGWHHAVNVLLHSGTVVGLFVALCLFTRRIWLSAVVAALFAVHPLRVESVAWVTERKDVLSGLFAVVTLITYYRYAVARSIGRYASVLCAYVMALASKPTVMPLPLALLLLDFWPLNRARAANRKERDDQHGGPPRSWSQLVIEKLPLFALSLAALIAAAIGNAHVFASGESVPRALQAANAFVSYIAYLGQFLLPRDLAALYPFPARGIAWWKVIGAIVVLTAVSAFCWRSRWKTPYLFVGWSWYVVMITPMIGFVQAGPIARADRYTYLPQIGILLAIVWWTADWARGVRARTITTEALAGASIIVLAWGAWYQSQFWRDSETLWQRALAVTQANNRAEEGLAITFLNRGELDQALEHFRRALDIQPTSVAHSGLASALLRKGRVDEAITHLAEAVGYSPDDRELRSNLAAALIRGGRLSEGIGEYVALLKDRPTDAATHANYARALYAAGRAEEGMAEWTQSLRLNERDASTHADFATALLKTGRIEEAIMHWRRALELEPERGDYANNVAIALMQQGRVSDAIRYWQKAAETQPPNVDAIANLAWILATSDNPSVRDGDRAIRLGLKAEQLTGGNDPRVLRVLATAYATEGRLSEAIAITRHALQLAEQQGNAELATTLRAAIRQLEDR